MNNSTAIPHSLRIEPHDALKRDFKNDITELNEAGFSNARIGYRCAVDERTVRNWKNGESDPPYHKAIIIIGMHHAYCVLPEKMLCKKTKGAHVQN